LNRADVTGTEPHEEPQEKQIKREGADTIALDGEPVDAERGHRRA
jgi:hypothetical protein